MIIVNNVANWKKFIKMPFVASDFRVRKNEKIVLRSVNKYLFLLLSFIVSFSGSIFAQSLFSTFSPGVSKRVFLSVSDYFHFDYKTDPSDDLFINYLLERCGIVQSTKEIRNACRAILVAVAEKYENCSESNEVIANKVTQEVINLVMKIRGGVSSVKMGAPLLPPRYKKKKWKRYLLLALLLLGVTITITLIVHYVKKRQRDNKVLRRAKEKERLAHEVAVRDRVESALKNRVDEVNQSLAAVKSLLKDKEGLVSNLQEELEARERELGVVQVAAQEHEKTLVMLRQEKKILQKAGADKMREAKKLQDSLEVEQAALHDLREAMLSQADEKAKLEHHLDRERGSLEQERARVKQVKTELSRMRGELSGAKVQLSKMGSDLAQERNRVVQEQKKNARLQKIVAYRNQAIKKHKRMIRALEKRSRNARNLRAGGNEQKKKISERTQVFNQQAQDRVSKRSVKGCVDNKRIEEKAQNVIESVDILNRFFLDHRITADKAAQLYEEAQERGGHQGTSLREKFQQALIMAGGVAGGLLVGGLASKVVQQYAQQKNEEQCSDGVSDEDGFFEIPAYVPRYDSIKSLPQRLPQVPSFSNFSEV